VEDFFELTAVISSENKIISEPIDVSADNLFKATLNLLKQLMPKSFHVAKL
jgi:hypothetical protein